jgi:integrase
VSYLEAAPRSAHTKDYLRRVRRALGDVALSSIDQDALPRLRSILPRLRSIVLRPGASNATYMRQILTPLRALLRYAARRGWCDMPLFESVPTAAGRTRFLLPDEAERLIAAAAPHLQPLLIFLLCTGARLSEALGLEWRDVDLQGARAIFWADQTKSGRRRVARLLPRCVLSLAGVPRLAERVFLAPSTHPYLTGRERGYGGQIKTAWRGALRRAGLADLSPHDLRHTWASWHYALHRDPFALKAEGGWSSMALVERYAHLLPAGQESAIRAFWGERWHASDTAKSAS